MGVGCLESGSTKQNTKKNPLKERKRKEMPPKHKLLSFFVTRTMGMKSRKRQVRRKKKKKGTLTRKGRHFCFSPWVKKKGTGAWGGCHKKRKEKKKKERIVKTGTTINGGLCKKGGSDNENRRGGDLVGAEGGGEKPEPKRLLSHRRRRSGDRGIGKS